MYINKNSKLIYILFGVVALIALLLGIALQHDREPHFHLETLDGQTFSAQNLKGKWVFINYWASWCTPCLKEIPELNEFAKNNQDNNILVFGVNAENASSAQVRRLVDKLSIQFPVLNANPAPYYNIGQVYELPVTYIISPKGILYSRLVGPQTQQSLAAEIKN